MELYIFTLISFETSYHSSIIKEWHPKKLGWREVATFHMTHPWLHMHVLARQNFPIVSIHLILISYHSAFTNSASWQTAHLSQRASFHMGMPAQHMPLRWMAGKSVCLRWDRCLKIWKDWATGMMWALASCFLNIYAHQNAVAEVSSGGEVCHYRQEVIFCYESYGEHIWGLSHCKCNIHCFWLCQHSLQGRHTTAVKP